MNRPNLDLESTPRKVPVTILTGFLGSGKTTLLNRILSEEHGKRIAVIENEYGEVGIDQALVIDADEEVFEMSNGCICCTVRGDLIRVLGNLMKRRDKFDYVLVETTGLADPGPVAQTFFMDDEIRAEFSLDGIVTLVDAAHIEQQLGRSDESTEQVAFADILVLNKTDLVNGKLLRERGVDIFRMKGFVSLAGESHRFVFQGVHMLFDGQPDQPWGDALRRNQLVFIGRNLDEQSMRQGFEACLI